MVSWFGPYSRWFVELPPEELFVFDPLEPATPWRNFPIVGGIITYSYRREMIADLEKRLLTLWTLPAVSPFFFQACTGLLVNVIAFLMSRLCRFCSERRRHVRDLAGLQDAPVYDVQQDGTGVRQPVDAPVFEMRH